MTVKIAGSSEVDRIGESETMNDVDIVSNDANARHTGVYDEFGNPAVVQVPGLLV